MKTTPKTFLRLGTLGFVVASAVGAQAINLATWNFGISPTSLSFAHSVPHSDALTSKSLITHTSGTGGSTVDNVVGTLTGAAIGDTAGRAMEIQKQVSPNATSHSLFFNISKGGHASLNVSEVRFVAERGSHGPVNWNLLASVNGGGFASVGSGVNAITTSFTNQGVTGLGMNAIQSVAFELKYTFFTAQGSSTVTTDNIRIEGTANPVPEPFTMVLGAAGLALAGRRRLRKA